MDSLKRSCVVAIQRDERNLDEWARWHLDVCGFDAIFLFDDMCSEHVFPEDLRDRVLQAPATAEGPHMGRQITSYDAWLYSQDARFYDYALFIDADEYLVLHGKKINEVMEEKDWPVVGFNWVFYSSKESEGPLDSLVRRFRTRAETPNRHLKVCLDLGKLRNYAGLMWFFANPHCLTVRDPNGQTAFFPAKCEGTPPSQDPGGILPPGFVYAEGPFNDRTGFDPAAAPYLAHFYAKTEEEFKAKISRGRADATRDSDQQFFRIEDRMWETRKECDLDEVEDEEMLRTLYGREI